MASNKVNKIIKFSLEFQLDNKINFLDITITLLQNNLFLTYIQNLLKQTLLFQMISIICINTK